MPAGGLSCNIQGPGWGIYPKINLWSFHSLLWDSHFFWGGALDVVLGYENGSMLSARYSFGQGTAAVLELGPWVYCQPHFFSSTVGSRENQQETMYSYIIIIYYIIFVATARIFFWKYRGSNMFFQRFWIDESCHSQHRTILSSLWNISLRK